MHTIRHMRCRVFFVLYFQRKIGERMKLTEGGKEGEIKRERERRNKNRASESALFCSSPELERSSCLHLVTEIFSSVYFFFILAWC